MIKKLTDDIEGMLFTEIPDDQIIKYHDFDKLIPNIIALWFYKRSTNIYLEMMGIVEGVKTSIYSVKLPLDMSNEQLTWFIEPLHLALKKYNKDLKDEKEKKLLDNTI